MSVSTKEAEDLLFLRASSSPKRFGSRSVYECQVLADGRSEFIPGED